MRRDVGDFWYDEMDGLNRVTKVVTLSPFRMSIDCPKCLKLSELSECNPQYDAGREVSHTIPESGHYWETDVTWVNEHLTVTCPVCHYQDRMEVAEPTIQEEEE